MGKVTSKYQVSIPKALADQLGVRPGDEVEWEVAGDEFRVRPVHAKESLSVEERLKMFRESMKQVAALQKKRGLKGSRDWTREDLYYDRGLNNR
jgi:AbrB family looped-hinge helix DNA binding protein